jgi:hypothetical protein
MSINELGIKADGVKHDYVLGLVDKPSIMGKAECLLDGRFDRGTLFKDIWTKIINAGGINDSITYIVSVTKGNQQSVYVGKTLGTFAKRYAGGPTGGLQKALSNYDPGSCFLDCVLYNVSHPALVELWCYQILADKKINVTNIQDPS